MPQPGVQLFDMKNAIAPSDTLALARIVALPDIGSQGSLTLPASDPRQSHRHLPGGG